MKSKHIGSILLVSCVLLGCSVNNATSEPKKEIPLSKDMIKSAKQFSSKSAAFLLNKQENICYSPMSAYLALSMSAQGAQDTTLKEIHEGLTFDGTNKSLAKQSKDLIQSLKQNEHILLGNSLWIDAQFSLDSAWKQTLEKQYFADTYSVDFNNENTNKQMVDWLNKQSKVTWNIDLPIQKDTKLSIMNTISLLNEWEQPFTQELTKQDNFYQAENTTIKADFMHMLIDSPYLKTEDYERTQLPLKDGNLMYFFLPTQQTTVEDVLQSDWLEELDNKQAEESKLINLALPKFKYNTDLNLKSMFQHLGVQQAFEQNAQFKNNIYISSILQGTQMDVNEFGVTATSYTKVDLIETARNPEGKVSLNFNRPFLYVLTTKDCLPLFIGSVYQPK
ncbi:serpin family protein [Amedibacillus sp. YH-ame6]